jgi:hypothetical protein
VPNVFRVEESTHSASSMILHRDLLPDDNGPPTIEIIRPADNGSGPIGFGPPAGFEAKVVDARGETTGLRISWASDVDGWMGTGSRIAYGFTTVGSRKVTITARDRFGATAKETITYNVQNVAPVAEIFLPAANSSYLRDQIFLLSGNGASTMYFALPCSRLTWTVDRIPGWEAYGCDTYAILDLVGPVVLTLTVTDDYGLSSSASVPINLVKPPANSPPAVTITFPFPPVRLAMNQSYVVSGVVTDPAGGPVTYRWTVFQAGAGETEISNAEIFRWVPGTVLRAEGRFELRLYGTNAQGVTAVAALEGQAFHPPR